MQPYELFIGLRYTRAKRRNHFISFISMISMLGIGLGVMALIVVLSVMNGFQKEIRARILGVTPHLQIMSDSGQINNWPQVLEIVEQHPEVRGILPDAEQRLTGLGDKMKKGSLSDLRSGAFNIVLGVDLARSLGAHVGDSVLLITPQGQITPAGMIPRLKQFHVVGIFEIGMAPYDNALALIQIEDAQKLYRLGDNVSGISGSLRNLDLAPQPKPCCKLTPIKEMVMDKLHNIHPGEILLEEFLLPMEISQTKLANSIGVPPRRINEIVLGKRGITADTALRLAKVFGTSVQFWMGLQDEYELREARAMIKDQLEQMMPIAA